MFLIYYATSAALVTAALNGASAFVLSPRTARLQQGLVKPSAVVPLSSTSRPFCVRRPTTTNNDNFRSTWWAAAAGSTSKGSRHDNVSHCVVMSAGPGQGEGKFFRLGGAEDNQSFGPRCILAGGLSPEDSAAVLSILEEAEDNGSDEGYIPLVLFTPDLADERVGDVLTDAAAISRRQGTDTETGLEALKVVSLDTPVILVSGFTNPELRGFLARFRQVTGVRAAFAKAVPNAMVKPVGKLCGEIAQDHADAMAGNLQEGQQET